MQDFLSVLQALSKTGNNGLLLLVVAFYMVRRFFFDEYFSRFLVVKEREISTLSLIAEKLSDILAHYKDVQ